MKKKLCFLLDKYNKMSLPLKASFWYLFASVLQKGVAFLTTPIFTRIMSKAEYGSFSLYQTWFSFLIIFTSLNLSGGVFNNGMTKYEKDKNHFVSSLLGLTMLITSIFFALYFVFSSFINQIIGFSTPIMIVMFLQLFFEPSFLLWSAEQRYVFNYKPLIIASIFIGVVNPVISVIAVLLAKDKLYARIFTYVGVLLIVYAVVTAIIIKNNNQLFDRRYWKYAINFNLPLIPHYLSLIILNQSDRIMIEKYCGTDQVALYAVAYSVSMIINIVVSAVNSTYIPYIYQSIKEDKVEKLRNTSSMIILLMAVLCMLPILLGPEVVSIMGDTSYKECVWVIPPVTASVFFVFLYNLFGTVEFYFEENKFVMIASCCGALLNVVLNSVFIPIYGFIAAGYTTFICYFVFVVAHYIFYKHVLKKNAKNELFDEKYIFTILACFIAIVFVCVLLYELTFVRYLVITLVLALLAMKRRDILGLLRSFKNKRG